MSNIHFKGLSVLGCERGYASYRSSCRLNCCNGEHCLSWLDKQFRRLDAYEDSGLSPEQVQELAKAKAEGRLVMLPCKAGDDVWCICPDGYNVAQYKVNEISFNGSRFEIQTGNSLDGFDYFGVWYATREAAEEALREEQDNERD